MHYLEHAISIPNWEFDKLACNDCITKALETGGWLVGDEMNIGIELEIVKQAETKFEDLKKKLLSPPNAINESTLRKLRRET